MLQLEVLQGLSHVLFPHPFYLSSAYSRSSGESFSSSELVSADLTGKLACINKTSSSVCSACLTFPGFLIHSFETLINSGQSNFSFFHRNFRSKSKGSDGGNKSKLGLSASPKGTTTPQSTTELFSPRLADTVSPQRPFRNTGPGSFKPSLKWFTEQALVKRHIVSVLQPKEVDLQL